MPESKRRTSSSHYHEPPSIRNNGIYIVGKTKIVVKNSGYMGYDTVLTPGSTRGGRLGTALFLLRHPLQCLSQLQNHMQEDGTLLMCMGGTEMIDSGCVLSESRRHARSENSHHCSKNDTDDRRTRIVNDEVQGAHPHRHRRRSSHRSRGRSSPRSTQSHRDGVSAVLLPHPRIIDAPVPVQEPQNVEGEMREDTPAEQAGSYEASVPLPLAINPYAPIPGDPPIVNHAHAQLNAQEDPELQDQLQGDFSDRNQRRARSHRGLPRSASGTDRDARRTRTPSDQSSRFDRESLDALAGPPDDPAPATNPVSLRKSPTVQEEANWHERHRTKPKVPPKISEGKLAAHQDKALINNLVNSPQFQRQREKQFGQYGLVVSLP